MSAEVRARVFQPFFTTKPVGQGTGLGLAVVHGVVQQSGGHIHVQSQLGAGTTFRLLFPAQTGALAAAVSTGDAAPRGTETVMLVEDEPEVRRIARQALERHGYTVLEAGNPVEALRLAGAAAASIDLLVTDVVMPGIDGRQVVDALRQRRPDLRVLYVSGYTDDAMVRRGVDAAAVAFLQKPFAPLELIRKVRAVLDTPSQAT
jgi:CheY-like chemotaxis protein